MGHFTKHWPADKVKEVKDVIRKHVSQMTFCLFRHITNSPTYISFKFIERYNEKNSQAQPKAACTCKTVSLKTSGWRPNIDDTDSSDDDKGCQQVTNKGDAYQEEWSLYLNTHEIVPDDMGVVRWWGVHFALSFLDFTLTLGSLVLWRSLSNCYDPSAGPLCTRRRSPSMGSCDGTCRRSRVLRHGRDVLPTRDKSTTGNVALRF